jgi:lipopolysaccharide/colanic/teichoic acid biosynthesis glycosyltransferase
MPSSTRLRPSSPPKSSPRLERERVHPVARKVAPPSDPDVVLIPRARPYDWVKSATDRSLALLLFVGCLPLMVLAALFVKLSSRGPIVYSQVRLGRGGRPYWIYKIRTMRDNCEALTGAKWATKGDPRITSVGRILRKTHIDELPQLWNVIRGDMSLVGPRPERPEIVTSLELAIPGYRGRLAVKPGVTGLAQIQLPPDVDLDSVREKLALDLCYVQRFGASLDARILVGTAIYLFGASFAGVRAAMALPSKPRPETAFLNPAAGTI